MSGLTDRGRRILEAWLFSGKPMLNPDTDFYVGLYSEEPPESFGLVSNHKYATFSNEDSSMGNETIDHPDHYNQAPVECIDVARWLGLEENANLFNAFKYLWRCGRKDDPKKELGKAVWYLEREISRLNGEDDSLERSLEKIQAAIDERDRSPRPLGEIAVEIKASGESAAAAIKKAQKDMSSIANKITGRVVTPSREGRPPGA